MNKAVLVIDMPDSCIKCPCFQFGMDNYCAVTDKTVYDYEKGRDMNCPLKPVPAKECEGGTWTAGGYIEDGFPSGWNACIEEIVGE